MRAWSTEVVGVPLGAAQVGTAVVLALVALGAAVSAFDASHTAERRRAEALVGAGAGIGLVGALADVAVVLWVGAAIALAGIVYGLSRLRGRATRR